MNELDTSRDLLARAKGLGVTGSGKSLSYNEPVLIYEKVSSGLKPYLVPIGKLVEDSSKLELESLKFYQASKNDKCCVLS